MRRECPGGTSAATHPEGYIFSYCVIIYVIYVNVQSPCFFALACGFYSRRAVLGGFASFTFLCGGYDFSGGIRQLAVAALHSRGAEPEAVPATMQTRQGICLREQATKLFRMAWEGVQHPLHLNQAIHPAFGIAVWLALADAQSIDSTDPQLSARIHFREAMATVLAHAIIWARRLHATAA